MRIRGTGSIIVVLATDAPLLPHQLTKLCRRIPIGMGLLGSGYENGSGNIFPAFSTADENACTKDVGTVQMLSDDRLDPFYKAVAETVEEAILDALFAAETIDGICGNRVYALPQEDVLRILKACGKAK